MCGILGYFSKDKISEVNLNNLINTKNILSERGPDDYGYIKNDFFFLSNSRLRIIDNEEYKLPIKKHSCIISFSGEILNYTKLKSFLKKNGYNFFTNTDTELILSLYDFYDEKFLNYIEGFFSIAIYDTKKKQLLLAIDRIGNKALFYNYKKGKLFFSSQQSYLIRSKLINFDINKSKIDEFIVFGDISSNQTLHQNIKKILPGTFLIFDFNELKEKRYYALEDSLLNLDIVKNEKIEKYEKVLSSAVKLWNNNCEFNKSIMLSGGIDSGLISIFTSDIAKKVNTYTANFIGDDVKSINEHDDVKKILDKFNYQNYLINFSSDDVLNLTNKIFSNFEEPLPSSSLLLYKIASFIHANNNDRVCFSGDGLDEIFGGYSRHQYALSKYNNSNNLEDISYGMNFLSRDRLKSFFKRKFDFPSERLQYLKKIKESNFDNLDLIYLNDIKFYLPMYLRSAEIIGMKHSIEFRAPFTDKNVIENSFLIKNSLRKNKSLLKLIFKKHIYKRFKKKKLFSTPFLGDQLKSGTYNEILNDISKNSKISSYFSIKGLRKMLSDHNKNDHSNFLIRLLTLHLFLESKL